MGLYIVGKNVVRNGFTLLPNKSVWNGTDGNNGEIPWHVGQDNPFKRAKDDDYLMLSHIQADGDELFHITTRFANLVYPKDLKVVKFFGETARMILEHL